MCGVVLKCGTPDNIYHMKKLNNLALVVVILIVFGLGIVAGIFVQKQSSRPLTVSPDSASEFQLVEDAWNITRSNYVDRTATQSQTLAYGTVSGMIDSLGDTGHRTFLNPSELAQQNDFEQGKLQGIGVEIQEKNGQVVIIAPLDNSPARKPGCVPRM